MYTVICLPRYDGVAMELAHALFASLEFQPMTRHDLKKFVDVSAAQFSTTIQSHIYKTLTDLKPEGWVGKKFIEQEGKLNRKKYSIIKTGRAELRRGMTALDTRIKTAEYLGGAKRGTTTSLSARRLGWANFLG